MRKIFAAALSLIICTAFIFGIFYFAGVGKLTEKRASKKYTKPASKFVVLPQSNQCGLFKIEENELKLVTQLPFSPCAKSRLGDRVPGRNQGRSSF